MSYSGRLVCDGYGNLLADEGERAGEPVAYKDGAYEFLAPGEPSHNKQHEQNVAEVVPTQSEDPELPGYVDPDNPSEDGAHHFDPPGEPNFVADKVAAKETSHTDAYKEGN